MKFNWIFVVIFFFLSEIFALTPEEYVPLCLKKDPRCKNLKEKLSAKDFAKVLGGICSKGNQHNSTCFKLYRNHVPNDISFIEYGKFTQTYGHTIPPWSSQRWQSIKKWQNSKEDLAAKAICQKTYIGDSERHNLCADFAFKLIYSDMPLEALAIYKNINTNSKVRRFNYQTKKAQFFLEYGMKKLPGWRWDSSAKRCGFSSKGGYEACLGKRLFAPYRSLTRSRMKIIDRKLCRYGNNRFCRDAPEEESGNFLSMKEALNICKTESPYWCQVMASNRTDLKEIRILLDHMCVRSGYFCVPYDRGTGVFTKVLPKMVEKCRKDTRFCFFPTKLRKK
jgi:hypothetical protein